MKRLAYDATTEEEVIQYFKTRYLQLNSFGMQWPDKTLYKNKYGYFLKFIDNNDNHYDSFYVLAQHRSRGNSFKLVDSLGKIATINDCGIVDFLKRMNHPFFVVDGIYDTVEYKLVENFYGDGQAQRSKIYFMNHIDEGILILNKINASDSAKAGFCLHPLVQDSPNLGKTFQELSEKVNAYNLGLSLEYRNIANQYLSKRSITSLDEIELSPLKEVNDMLIADKIQNYKDFILYHRGTHPRSNELENYFNNWLDKLDCRETFNWYIDYSKRFENEIKVISVD